MLPETGVPAQQDLELVSQIDSIISLFSSPQRFGDSRRGWLLHIAEMEAERWASVWTLHLELHTLGKNQGVGDLLTTRNIICCQKERTVFLLPALCRKTFQYERQHDSFVFFSLFSLSLPHAGYWLYWKPTQCCCIMLCHRLTSVGKYLNRLRLPATADRKTLCLRMFLCHTGSGRVLGGDDCSMTALCLSCHCSLCVWMAVWRSSTTWLTCKTKSFHHGHVAITIENYLAKQFGLSKYLLTKNTFSGKTKLWSLDKLFHLRIKSTAISFLQNETIQIVSNSWKAVML